MSDFNIVKKTIEAAEVSESDTVIEIGPGLGGLTEGLLMAGADVCAVELDRAIHPVLTELFKGNDKLQLIEADALKLDLRSVQCRPNKLVSNLPYNIAAPLLVTYLDQFDWIKTYVVMIQKEVAERILARPSTSEYGGLSVKIQLMAEVKIVANVSRNSFIPRPNVDSALLRLERRDQRLEARERQRFFKMIGAAFSKKRKTVYNSLSSGLNIDKEQTKSLLEQAGINPIKRPQDIGIDDYLRLFSLIDSAYLA